MDTDYFHLNQIDVPNYARKPDTTLYGVTLAEYDTLQEHRQAIIQLVHNEVTAYLNTKDLVFDGDEDGFPNRSKMTGEYYIAHEMYEKHVGPVWFQIGIQTHFLEKQWIEGQTDFDYLGLEVWIKCVRESWSFEIFRNTDSSSI